MKNQKKRSMTSDELFRKINNELEKISEHKIDKQDMSTLLGIASWCGIIDRKLALYYFGKK